MTAPPMNPADLTAEGEAYATIEPRLRFAVDTPHAAGTTFEIVPGLHWLRMPLPIDLNHINLWLLEDGDGFTLVDTGMPASLCTGVWEQLESTLFAHRPPQAFTAGDAEHTGVWFGEAAGLIYAIEPAAAIVERMVDEAVLHLQRYGGATLTEGAATSASQAPR